MRHFFEGLSIGNAVGILLCLLIVGICIAEYLSSSNKEPPP